VRATDAAQRGGALVAAFPVETADQVMLVTSSGQSIRVPVAGIRFMARTGGGVRVLDLNGSGEMVVSVARVVETEGE
jgi:DNA gyrase subunit A